jgi:integrase
MYMAIKVQRRTDKPGWWVFIHYRGQRRKKSFGKDKALAGEIAKKLDAKLKLGEAGVRTQSGITIDEYAVTWLDRIRHARKHTTHEDYQARLARDILPVLTGLDLDDITRERVKGVAFAGLNRQQAPKTVQNTIRVLSSLLSHAQEDGLIQQNHAMRPGSFLPTINKRHAVDPLTREEVATFLATVQAHAPHYYPLFLCAVRTGLRMARSWPSNGKTAISTGAFSISSAITLIGR